MYRTFAVTLEVKPEDVLSLLSVYQLSKSAAQVARLLASVVRPVREIDLGAPLHALRHGVAQQTL
jgi:hypothetical protein